MTRTQCKQCNGLGFIEKKANFDDLIAEPGDKKEEIVIRLIGFEAEKIRRECKENNEDIIEKCIDIINHYFGCKEYISISKEDLKIVLE